VSNVFDGCCTAGPYRRPANNEWVLFSPVCFPGIMKAAVEKSTIQAQCGLIMRYRIGEAASTDDKRYALLARPPWDSSLVITHSTKFINNALSFFEDFYFHSFRILFSW